jgi:hypothetical protein
MLRSVDLQILLQLHSRANADATARANGWRYSFEPRPMGRKRRILGMDYVHSLSRPFPTTVAIVTQFLAVEILR